MFLKFFYYLISKVTKTSNTSDGTINEINTWDDNFFKFFK